MTTRYLTVLRMIVLAALAVGVVWFAAGKFRYSNAKTPLPNGSRTEVAMARLDQNSKAFLGEQRTNWVYADNRTVGKLADTLSDLMKAVGLVPSIQNLTNVLTARTTGFLRWLPSAKRHSLLGDCVKTIFQDFGDGTLRVSEDGHIALVWMDINTVIVFKDGTNAMEGSRYDRKVNKAEAVRDAIAQLQGEWLLLSGFVGGQPATSVRQVYRGNAVTTISPGRPDLKETITVDPTKPAKTIDFEMTDASGETRKRLGIYSLGNDRLILDVADPDGERPTHFFDGGHMSEWRREQPAVR